MSDRHWAADLAGEWFVFFDIRSADVVRFCRLVRDAGGAAGREGGRCKEAWAVATG